MKKIPMIVAALCFAAFPLLRPYGLEVGLDAAPVWASWRWVPAHLLGALGFVLLGFAGIGLRATYALGVAAILPYYGAESFALQVFGREALASGDAHLIVLAEQVRYGVAQLVLFGVGLVLIAVAAGLWAWGSGRSAAVWVAALALATYLPQFLLPAWGRIAHGLLLAVALLAVALKANSARAAQQHG